MRNALDSLPNFSLDGKGGLSDYFLSVGVSDFRSAGDYVWQLPYGRNSDRADFRLVLKEGRGTCSTKHALLAELAAEQKQSVFSTLGIYEMDARNTAGIGAALDEFGLESLPEAHCYLTYAGKRIDVTRFSNGEAAQPIERFLYEERIRPDQIGGYKLALHRTFFRNWMRERKLGKRYDFNELWEIREKCIFGFAQSV